MGSSMNLNVRSFMLKGIENAYTEMAIFSTVFNIRRMIVMPPVKSSKNKRVLMGV